MSGRVPTDEFLNFASIIGGVSRPDIVEFSIRLNRINDGLDILHSSTRTDKGYTATATAAATAAATATEHYFPPFKRNKSSTFFTGLKLLTGSSTKTLCQLAIHPFQRPGCSNTRIRLPL